MGGVAYDSTFSLVSFIKEKLSTPIVMMPEVKPETVSWDDWFYNNPDSGNLRLVEKLITDGQIDY